MKREFDKSAEPARILEVKRVGDDKEREWYYLCIQGKPKRRISKTEYTKERERYPYMLIGKGKDEEVYHAHEDYAYRYATQRAFAETTRRNEELRREFSETDRAHALAALDELESYLRDLDLRVKKVRQAIRGQGG